MSRAMCQTSFHVVCLTSGRPSYAWPTSRTCSNPTMPVSFSVLTSSCPAPAGQEAEASTSSLSTGPRGPAFHQSSSVAPLSSNTRSSDVNTFVASTSHTLVGDYITKATKQQRPSRSRPASSAPPEVPY
ncbi:uncharacterized protein LOC142559568 [Dermacentor variabilis]|uniref:uncharacterized protein LOC142559568 n=1 Tax=Dermacentor variabilis TaxID=34621 RepID=UPI003F5BDF47